MTQPPEPASGNPYANDDQPDERPVETVRTSIDQYGGPVTRIPLDEMTSDQLDALYDERDAAQGDRDGWRERADTYRDAWHSAKDRVTKQRTRAERAEATLTAVCAELTALEAELYPVADDGMVIAIRRIRAVLDQHGQTPKETT